MLFCACLTYSVTCCICDVRSCSLDICSICKSLCDISDATCDTAEHDHIQTDARNGNETAKHNARVSPKSLKPSLVFLPLHQQGWLLRPSRHPFGQRTWGPLLLLPTTTQGFESETRNGSQIREYVRGDGSYQSISAQCPPSDHGRQDRMVSAVPFAWAVSPRLVYEVETRVGVGRIGAVRWDLREVARQRE